MEQGDLAVRADVQMPGLEQMANRIGSLIGSVAEGSVEIASSVAPHIGPTSRWRRRWSITFKPGNRRHRWSDKPARSQLWGIYATWTGTFTEEHAYLGRHGNSKLAIRARQYRRGELFADLRGRLHDRR